MKFLITFFTLVTIALISASKDNTCFDLKKANKLFKNFKEDNSRNYKDENDEQYRYGIFKKTLELMNMDKERDASASCSIPVSADLINSELTYGTALAPPHSLFRYFDNYIRMYRKHYKSEAEKSFRFGVLAKTVEVLNELQTKKIHKESVVHNYPYGQVAMNHFSGRLTPINQFEMDRTRDELVSK